VRPAYVHRLAEDLGVAIVLLSILVAVCYLASDIVAGTP
jgi:hypothetical protein